MSVSKTILEVVLPVPWREALSPLLSYSSHAYAEAAHRLASSRTLLLTSGFFIPKAKNFENDGLLGALALWKACEKKGKQVYFAAEPRCLELWQKVSSAPPELLIELPFTQETQEKIKDSIDTVIAVERPGKSSDGKYYNWSGRDITSEVAESEPLLELVEETIAVGDRGNELGMGPKRGLAPPPLAASCAKWQLFAQTSNWGVYGLIRAWEILYREKHLLWSSAEEEEAQRQLLKLGVVDGLLARPAMSVDGIPWEEYQNGWEPLRWVERV